MYVGIPSYLRETFEAHKVGQWLSLCVIVIEAGRTCMVGVECISTDGISILTAARLKWLDYCLKYRIPSREFTLAPILPPLKPGT